MEPDLQDPRGGTGQSAGGLGGWTGASGSRARRAVGATEGAAGLHTQALLAAGRGAGDLVAATSRSRTLIFYYKSVLWHSDRGKSKQIVGSKESPGNGFPGGALKPHSGTLGSDKTQK